MKTTNTAFKHSDRLYDVVVIRSIAIILVVAFHAYGMMYWGEHFPQETREVYRRIYSTLLEHILKFRMPLFIFISGFLFAYLEGGGSTALSKACLSISSNA